MRYFILEEEKKYVNRVRPYKWNKKISSEVLYNKSYSKIPKRIILEIEPNVNVDFVDVVTVPFLMFSEKIFKMIKIFEPNMQCKEIVLLDKKNGNAEVYYLPILDTVDCLGEDTKFNLDHSVIERPVLCKEKIADQSIFSLPEGPKGCCVVRMDLLECILRRDAYGFKIVEPEYESEGEE